MERDRTAFTIISSADRMEAENRDTVRDIFMNIEMKKLKIATQQMEEALNDGNNGSVELKYANKEMAAVNATKVFKTRR